MPVFIAKSLFLLGFFSYVNPKGGSLIWFLRNHLFSPQHSSCKHDSAFGLSKTFSLLTTNDRFLGNNIAVGTDYSLCEIVMLSLCRHLSHCLYCIHSCIVSLKELVSSQPPFLAMADLMQASFCSFGLAKRLKNRRFNMQGIFVLWKSKLKALEKNLRASKPNLRALKMTARGS